MDNKAKCDICGKKVGCLHKIEIDGKIGLVCEECRSEKLVEVEL